MLKEIVHVEVSFLRCVEVLLHYCVFILKGLGCCLCHVQVAEDADLLRLQGVKMRIFLEFFKYLLAYLQC